MTSGAANDKNFIKTTFLFQLKKQKQKKDTRNNMKKNDINKTKQ